MFCLTSVWVMRCSNLPRTIKHFFPFTAGMFISNMWGCYFLAWVCYSHSYRVLICTNFWKFLFVLINSLALGPSNSSCLNLIELSAQSLHKEVYGNIFRPLFLAGPAFYISHIFLFSLWMPVKIAIASQSEYPELYDFSSLMCCTHG